MHSLVRWQHKTISLLIALGLALGVTAASLQPAYAAQPEAAAADSFENAGLEAFPLEEVTLLDSYWKELAEANADMMEGITADQLLYSFRKNANQNYGASLATPGSGFGGWAAAGHNFAGHLEGHYMSAAAMQYAQSQDSALKTKLDAVIAGLAEVQNALTPKIAGEPIGYLSAFPETRFDALEKGQASAVPWYMIHKILAGLMDVYTYTDNAQALDVAKKLGDWVVWRTDRLDDAQMLVMLKADEYGGMNDALWNLYAMTDDDDYARVAARFEEKPNLLDPLYNGEDILSGKHGNTMLAKLVGAANTYTQTGDDYYRVVVQNFWDILVNQGHTYVIGGNTRGEHFTDPNTLSNYLMADCCETCNVYNLLKITRQAICWTGDSSYADYYEKALFNQIFGSINPNDGDKTYFIGMQASATKDYRDTVTGAFCCNGSGLESFSKINDSIYFHTDDAVYVNLFIPSELASEEMGFGLKQTTDFPESPTTTFTITEAADVALYIRVPSWSKTFTVKINGQEQKVSANDKGYAVLDQAWAVGDTIEVTMSMEFGVEKTEKDNVVAFTYGPLAMVGVGKDIADGELVVGEQAAFFAGLSEKFVAEKDALTFTLTDNTDKEITFRPFYTVVKEQYTTYWNVEKVPSLTFTTNLALKKTVTADESYNNDYVAQKAVDGNPSTRWCVKGPTANHWFQIDLGKNYFISDIKLVFELPANHRFRVLCSLDGENWTEFADYSDTRSEASALFKMSGDAYARYVKMEFDSNDNGHWCSLYEFEVYGGEGTADEVTASCKPGEKVSALLPENATVSFPEGQKLTYPVTWDVAEDLAYAESGTYTVTGTVNGWIPVQATVSVDNAGGAGFPVIGTILICLAALVVLAVVVVVVVVCLRKKKQNP